LFGTFTARRCRIGGLSWEDQLASASSDNRCDSDLRGLLCVETDDLYRSGQKRVSLTYEFDQVIAAFDIDRIRIAVTPKIARSKISFSVPDLMHN